MAISRKQQLDQFEDSVSPASGAATMSASTQLVGVIVAHPARVAGNPERIKTGYGEDLLSS